MLYRSFKHMGALHIFRSQDTLQILWIYGRLAGPSVIRLPCMTIVHKYALQVHCTLGYPTIPSYIRMHSIYFVRRMTCCSFVRKDALHIPLRCLTTNLEFRIPCRFFEQQTEESWTETDSKPISKRSNDVRIDSTCKVLAQSRFTRHTFSQHEIWLDQIQLNCNGPTHLRAACANSDNSITFHLRLVRINYNVGPNKILIVCLI